MRCWLTEMKLNNDGTIDFSAYKRFGTTWPCFVHKLMDKWLQCLSKFTLGLNWAHTHTHTHSTLMSFRRNCQSHRQFVRTRKRSRYTRHHMTCPANRSKLTHTVDMWLSIERMKCCMSCKICNLHTFVALKVIQNAVYVYVCLVLQCAIVLMDIVRLRHKRIKHIWSQNKLVNRPREMCEKATHYKLCWHLSLRWIALADWMRIDESLAEWTLPTTASWLCEWRVSGIGIQFIVD